MTSRSIRRRRRTILSLLPLFILAGATVPQAASASEWVPESLPSVSGATSTHLSAVSCINEHGCAAVGAYTDSSGKTHTLAERRASSTWTVQSTPNPGEGGTGELTGVSCTSESYCVASGVYKIAGTARPLIEVWNGVEWKQQTISAAAGAFTLKAVSCISVATRCTAVGSHNSGGKVTATAFRWNGEQWTEQWPPQPNGASETVLNGVYCSELPQACTAVGTVNGASTLAETWVNESWKIDTAPELPVSSLNGVSCLFWTNCKAVGRALTGSKARKTLAESWNGTEWLVQPNAAVEGGLNAVSCWSESNCFATGFVTVGPTATAEDWYGTEWQTQTVRLPVGTTTSELVGVSHFSSFQGVAVGNYRGPSVGPEKALAERWE